MTPDAATAVEAAYHEEWGRVVAALIRRTGDWDLAEESAAEAFAGALAAWSRDGVPDRPGAWLTTVAGRHAVDRLRRRRRGGELLTEIGRDPLAPALDGREDPALQELFEAGETIEDDRLLLIFTCCHPALALDARVALTLWTLAGLTTAEIARAFLVAEPTMAKRLTRAKARIAGAGIPYRVPPAALLPERTGGVLAVLYLLFNEGYAASAGTALIRGRLCEEAIRLARAVDELMDRAPEPAGLLALLLLQHSRRAARTDPNGDLVTLEEQDRSRWDAAAIAEGTAALGRALRRGPGGTYCLQAAIAAEHAKAESPEATDWATIATLYDRLLALTASPVVALNRAVAIGMTGDLRGALALVEALAADAALGGYPPLAATRADLLRRVGDATRARPAYEHARALAGSEPERRFFTRRLRELAGE